jgi:hypothetical protein
MRPGEESLPLRGLSFWEHNLPWALLKVLQTVHKIKSEQNRVDRECAVVCSRGVTNVITPTKLLSATARPSAGGRRGSGRAGKRSENTGVRRPAKKNDRRNAGVAESW